MSEKFKVGDKVKVINIGENIGAKNGDILTVKYIKFDTWASCNLISFEEKNSPSGLWEKRLVKANSEIIKKRLKIT